MAFYDNKLWLLSHIRNSFISTDDTGMSETIAASENFVKQLPRNGQFDAYPGFEDKSEDEDDLDELDESLEIQLNYGFSGVGGSFRQRSNTAHYIEQMNAAKRKAQKIKIIKWEQPKSDVESDEFFTDIQKSKKPHEIDLHLDEPSTSFNTAINPTKKTVSRFSQELNKHANQPRNPFVEFARVDGSARMDVAVKKYRIFMTMLTDADRNFPISVSIIATAKVYDLIGLTLLKYSMTKPDFKFKQISNYGLCIVEEDGEVDRDLPLLSLKEYIGKFTFSTLGLVELENQKSISFDLSEAVNDAKDEPPQKEKSTKETEDRNEEHLARMRLHNTAMEALLYKNYRVAIVNKLRAKTDVNLGVSGEKIEIEPLQSKNSFWARQKALYYKMDNIAGCEVLEVKGNKTTFKLIYNVTQNSSFSGNTLFGTNISPTFHSPSPTSGSAFKHHDFEAENRTAEEIVQKINHILEIRSSISRREYKTYLALKSTRSKNFNFKNFKPHL